MRLKPPASPPTRTSPDAEPEHSIRPRSAGHLAHSPRAQQRDGGRRRHRDRGPGYGHPRRRLAVVAVAADFAPRLLSGLVLMWLGLALRARPIAPLGAHLRLTVEVEPGQKGVAAGPDPGGCPPSYHRAL